MPKPTWTNEEMKERLEYIGYDLTDDNGNFSQLVMSDVAVNVEKHTWHEDKEVWS